MCRRMVIPGNSEEETHGKQLGSLSVGLWVLREPGGGG